MPTNSVNKLLVPLDGSGITERMVPYAAGMAKAAGAGLVLLEVVADSADTGDAETYLEGVASKMRDSGMGVATAVKQGETAPSIVGAANEYGADVIVMTGHATREGRKDLLGSTAHSVLKLCTTPVLVVPLSFSAYTPPAAVVIGHDGTVNSQAVLDPAITLARAISCELVLVRAVDPVAGLGGAAKYYRAVDDFAEDDLEKLRDELIETGLKVTSHVGSRLPEQELISMADSRLGSIIAVSTRSLSAELNVLGSTTDRLVRSQTHAVLAVPEK